MSNAEVEVRRVAVLLFSAALRQPQTRLFLDALRRHSPHEFVLCNVAGVVPDLPDADDFDAVLVHGSVPLASLSARLDHLHSWLSAFPGQTIAFVNNEFQGVMSPAEWTQAARVDHVFSTLDESSINRVYTQLEERVTVETVLPVYSGDEFQSMEPLPHSQRPLDMVFREVEPAIKHGPTQTLANLVEKLSSPDADFGLTVDVSWGAEEEVLSAGRLSFMAEGRATFMIEQSFLVAGDAVMDESARRLPPGFFEAAACKTGLILVEGEWGSLVEPLDHYFPLKEDLSNLNEALTWLADKDQVEATGERAYQQLIAGGEFSIRQLASRLDEVLESVSLIRHNESAAWSGPALVDLMCDQWLQERSVLSVLRDRERLAKAAALHAPEARSSLAEQKANSAERSERDRQLRLASETQLADERVRRSEIAELLASERQRRQEVASVLEEERRHRRDLTDRLLRERARREEFLAVGAEERDRRMDLLGKLEVGREVRTELLARLENEKDRRSELLSRLSEERERRLEYAEQMRDRLQKEHNLRLETRTKMLSERDRRLQTDEKIEALRTDIARRDDRISDLVDQLRDAWRNEEGG